MDGGNSNQGNQGKPTQQNNQQKPGLSWTQPVQTTSTQNSNQQKTAVKPMALQTAQEDSTGRVIGIIVGIIVVFALAAWGIVALNKRAGQEALSSTASTTSEVASMDDDQPATGSETTSPASGSTAPTEVTAAPTPTKPHMGTGSASLVVPGSQSAGDTVKVTDLSISEPTWVLVYDSVNGAPNRILGAGLYFKGDTTGSIELLKPTVTGQTYFVSAAVDNGDKKFVKADESFVADSTGAQMWIKFSVQ